MNDVGTSGAELAEYNALRAEILFRLTAQQNLINYMFIVAGILAPLIGIQQTLGANRLLIILLLGPMICTFLQAVYLKHHLFMQLLGDYISKIRVTEKCSSGQNQQRPFSGWELYLTDALYERPIAWCIAGTLGVAENSFAILVSGLYIVSFLAITWSTSGSVTRLPAYIKGLYYLDIFLLISTIAMGVLGRMWVIQLRRSNTKFDKKPIIKAIKRQK